MQKEEIGVLNIGIIETLTINILPKVLKKFAEYKPNISCNFIVANSHPFAKKKSISIDKLLEYPLIIGGKNCLYSIRLEEELLKLPNRPFCYFISQISSIPSFVEKLSGIGVIISSLQLAKNFVKIPVNIVNPYIEIGILQQAKNHYMSSTKKLFLQILKEEILLNQN